MSTKDCSETTTLKPGEMTWTDFHAAAERLAFVRWPGGVVEQLSYDAQHRLIMACRPDLSSHPVIRRKRNAIRCALIEDAAECEALGMALRAAMDAAMATLAVGQVVRVRVVFFAGWGAFVALPCGIRAFLPRNNISHEPDEPCKTLKVGMEFDAKISHVVPGDALPLVIVNRRALLPQPAPKRLDGLAVGDIVPVTVLRFIPQGVIVALPGGTREAFIPTCFVSRERVTDPQTVLRIGDTFDAKVKNIDLARGHVTVSRRSLFPKLPWSRGASAPAPVVVPAPAEPDPREALAQSLAQAEVLLGQAPGDAAPLRQIVAEAVQRCGEGDFAAASAALDRAMDTCKTLGLWRQPPQSADPATGRVPLAPLTELGATLTRAGRWGGALARKGVAR